MGFAPADPLRCIIAAAADLVPGVVIAAFSMGLQPEAMLSPAIFIGPSAEPLAWLLALGLTIIHCAAGEAMTGRTIGKALTGCEVASMRRDKDTGKIELGAVRVWQALVRNLIRWGVRLGFCCSSTEAVVIRRMQRPAPSWSSESKNRTKSDEATRRASPGQQSPSNVQSLPRKMKVVSGTAR